MEENNPMKIIIVGGSLAGLMNGLALKRLEHYVQILERNSLSNFQGNGPGIIIGKEIREYIEQFDQSEQKLTIPLISRHYLDIHGNEIHREDGIIHATSWHLLYQILRENFDQGGKTIYDFGANVMNMKVEKNGVTLFYEQNNQEKSIQGDILLAADGASSQIRRLLVPEVERKYVGYVVWRGTVLESEVSQSLITTLSDCLTFYHSTGLQFASYTIPAKNGTLDRFINWVWYDNYQDPEEILTDCDGKRHRWTVPRNKLHLKVHQNLKEKARESLPPQFAELVSLTQSPFVQAISDVLSPQSTY